MNLLRWTIGRWMLAIAGVALLLGLVQAFGAFILVIPVVFLGPIGLGWGAWVLTRGSALRAGWLLLIVVVPASLGTAWLCVYPLFLLGPTLIWLSAFASAPMLGMCVLTWCLQHQQRGCSRWSLSVRIIVCLVGALPLSMAATFWPLHLAFQLARPKMLQLADQVAAGKPVRFPQQVGAYSIVDIRVDPNQAGNVAMLLDADPNGETGFVRMVERPRTGLIGALGIIPSDYEIGLGDGWSYMIED